MAPALLNVKRGVVLAQEKQENRLGYKMVIPSVILVAVISIYPLLYGVILSFQSYFLLKPNKPRGFIGLENYKALIHDTEFFGKLGYTFIYAISIVVVGYLFGLFLAHLLNRNIRGKGLYRALILLPWVVSPAIAATNWLWVLNDRVGVINRSLLQFGIISKPILFLASSELAKVTVIFTAIWKGFPFFTIVILAGLQSIPGELYESAYMDGAGFWKALRYITMPMIKNISLVATTLMFIWNFNNFDNIYLLTRGGPSDATFTLPILTYYTAFYRTNMGYASTIGTGMLVVLLIAALFYLRALRRREN
jgi:ABC-type sugar transport system permease subunit